MSVPEIIAREGYNLVHCVCVWGGQGMAYALCVNVCYTLAVCVCVVCMCIWVVRMYVSHGCRALL